MPPADVDSVTGRDDGPAGWPFDAMLEEFRSFGGKAENIRLGEGEIGRGLFVVDPDVPVVLNVPLNLLADEADVRFEGERMFIAEDSSLAPRARDFINRYYAHYSYGGGGREDCASFLRGIDALPDDIKLILQRDLAVSSLLAADDFEARVRQRFLRSRMIGRDGRRALMPIVELANHQSGLRSATVTATGVDLGGRYADEIRHAYHPLVDPLQIFLAWGFVNREPAAFSVPMTIRVGQFEFRIGRDLSSFAQASGFPAPRVAREGDVVTLSSLQIGFAADPSVPRSVFHAVMRQLTGSQFDELFDYAAHENRIRFLGLLEALRGRQDDMCASLASLCIEQLRALSFAIGARPL